MITHKPLILLSLCLFHYTNWIPALSTLNSYPFLTAEELSFSSNTQMKLVLAVSIIIHWYWLPIACSMTDHKPPTLAPRTFLPFHPSLAQRREIPFCLFEGKTIQNRKPWAPLYKALETTHNDNKDPSTFSISYFPLISHCENPHWIDYFIANVPGYINK